MAVAPEQRPVRARSSSMFCWRSAASARKRSRAASASAWLARAATSLASSTSAALCSARASARPRRTSAESLWACARASSCLCQRRV
eukprot:scaffold26835_cov107-Isochrysis_galbana.AAC.6